MPNERSAIKDWIKADWSADVPYYAEAETDAAMAIFWRDASPFKRRFDQLNHTRMVELACGRGRHSSHILKHYPPVERITAVDINERNIEVCAERFAHEPRILLLVNNGYDLSAIAGASATAVFSYDAMVHFEYDDVIGYIGEFFRVLEPGGRALVHHSNNDRQPGNLCEANMAWRNFMSAALFNHVAMRTGFLILDQEITDWGEHKSLDCITLLEKPAAVKTQ